MIILSDLQTYNLRGIREWGAGVILFDDTSTIVVCDKKGNALEMKIEIPYKIFDQLEFMGFLVYEREIGRDQYFYKVK